MKIEDLAQDLPLAIDLDQREKVGETMPGPFIKLDAHRGSAAFDIDSEVSSDQVGGVMQSIKRRGVEQIAGESLAPFGEADVAGDHGGGALVALGNAVAGCGSSPAPGIRRWSSRFSSTSAVTPCASIPRIRAAHRPGGLVFLYT